MNAYILDYDILAEHNLSINEFIFILSHYRNDDNIDISLKILNSLQDKQFIKISTDEKTIILREKSKLLIEFLQIEGIESVKNKKVVKKSSRVISSELNEFIKEYRSLWKGLKPGSMGSENNCRDKLYKWMTENPGYSKEDILKAAKIYLNTLDNYKYLQAADYFILKDGNSRLSAFIDEIEVAKDDWTTNLN